MCKFSALLACTAILVRNQLMAFFSLLSNAGLPETNPLLLDEDLDQSVGEDFQKMLNDWENHIGAIQVHA